jgi:hypothetical protein
VESLVNMNTLISQFPKWLGLGSIAIEYLDGNTP